MIETALLVWLCRTIGKKAHAKGLSAEKYRFFVVIAWFTGEITGFSQILFGGRAGINLLMFLITYVSALMTAGFLVWFVFKIVNIPPDLCEDDETNTDFSANEDRIAERWRPQFPFARRS